MVTKKEASSPQEEGFNAVSWLSPFDNYVWLMIVVTIFVSTVIHWCLEVLNPDSDRRRRYKLDPIETLWMMATYVFLENLNVQEAVFVSYT
jgi:hypothetical protein